MLKYGQKLNSWAALGWAGHVRKVGCTGLQKCGGGLWQHFFVQCGLNLSFCRGEQGFQSNIQIGLELKGSPQQGLTRVPP